MCVCVCAGQCPVYELWLALVLLPGRVAQLEARGSGCEGVREQSLALRNTHTNTHCCIVVGGRRRPVVTLVSSYQEPRRKSPHNTVLKPLSRKKLLRKLVPSGNECNGDGGGNVGDGGSGFSRFCHCCW